MKNLAAVLEAAGSSIDNVVKVNIFLTNMENFADMNNVYAKFFQKGVKPCRTVSSFPSFFSLIFWTEMEDDERSGVRLEIGNEGEREGCEQGKRGRDMC